MIRYKRTVRFNVEKHNLIPVIDAMSSYGTITVEPCEDTTYYTLSFKCVSDLHAHCLSELMRLSMKGVSIWNLYV